MRWGCKTVAVTAATTFIAHLGRTQSFHPCHLILRTDDHELDHDSQRLRPEKLSHLPKFPSWEVVVVVVGGSNPGLSHSGARACSTLSPVMLLNEDLRAVSGWAPVTPGEIPDCVRGQDWLGGVLGIGAKNLQGPQTLLPGDPRYRQAASDSSTDTTPSSEKTHTHTHCPMV